MAGGAGRRVCGGCAGNAWGEGRGLVGEVETADVTRGLSEGEPQISQMGTDFFWGRKRDAFVLRNLRQGEPGVRWCG